MNGKIFFGLISAAVLAVCVLLVRQCLLELGLPDGSMLESLARQLRGGELTAAEAVEVFCRELIDHGAP